MSRKPSTAPKANKQIPVTQSTYDLVTFLRDRLSNHATYEDIMLKLANCYIKRYNIPINEGDKNET